MPYRLSVLLALKTSDMKMKIKGTFGRKAGGIIHKASKLMGSKQYKFHWFGLLSQINVFDALFQRKTVYLILPRASRDGVAPAFQHVVHVRSLPVYPCC